MQTRPLALRRRADAAACVVTLAVAMGAAVLVVPARSGADTEPWRLVYATEVEGRRGLDVYVVNVPAGKPRRVAGVRGLNDFSPTWSPNGRWIAFRRNPVRGDEGEIFIVSPSGRNLRNLTRSPRVADWSPAWSPSGREIAFFSMMKGGSDLWTMRTDGSGKRRLTRDGGLNEYPSFSPDGRHLAFESHRLGQYEIFVMTRRGTTVRNISRHPALDQKAAWSPDGAWIAFMSDREGSEDVFVVHPDGSGLRNLTNTDELEEMNPTWAPDGRLTFSRYGGTGPVELWVTNVDGTDATRLETLADPVFAFDWLDQ